MTNVRPLDLTDYDVDADDLTEIVMIIDRSGSMYGIKDDAIGGFNQFLEDQKNLGGAARLTLVLFSTDYHVIHESAPVIEVPELNDDTYNCGGGTALYDAVGKTIASMKTLLESRENQKVIVAILTDGANNASQKYTRDQVFEMIEERKKDGWEVVFLGANQDAFEESGNIGVASAMACNFAPDSDGTRRSFRAVSRAVGCYRSSGVVKQSMSRYYDESVTAGEGNAAQAGESDVEWKAGDDDKDGVDCSSDVPCDC